MGDRFKLAGLAGVVASAAWQWHGVGMLCAGAGVFLIGWVASLVGHGDPPPAEG